jgi:hypothetical protein
LTLRSADWDYGAQPALPQVQITGEFAMTDPTVPAAPEPEPTPDLDAPVPPAATPPAPSVEPPVAPPAYTAPPAAPPVVPPAPPAAPPAYAAPAAPPPTYAPPVAYAAAPTKSPVLSIISLIVGILGLIAFGWGLLLSIGAVVLGHLGQRKEPQAKGLWLTGLITGYVGIVLNLILFSLFVILPLVFLASYSTPGFDY